MKTTRPKTPVEIAMDKSMGLPAGGSVPVMIMLNCPKCRKTQRAKADEIDPEGTAKIEIICPDCDDGDFHDPVYFDAAGKQLGLAP